MDIEAYVRGMLVSREELETLVCEALRTVRRNLERPRKRLPAGLLVLARRGHLPFEQVAITLGDFDKEVDAKSYWDAGAKFAGSGRCPMACAMFAQSWMVPEADYQKAPNVAPWDHPGSKEVVVIGGGALGAARKATCSWSTKRAAS